MQVDKVEIAWEKVVTGLQADLGAGLSICAAASAGEAATGAAACMGDGTTPALVTACSASTLDDSPMCWNSLPGSQG